MINICEHCGESFEPSKFHPQQRFCGEICQRAWWKENQEARKKYVFTCKRCGEQYTTIYKNRNQYCGRECSLADASNYVKPYTFETQEIKCNSCGSIFNGYVSNGSYCSDECREKGYPLVCEYCNNEFYNKMPFTKYCSEECSYSALLKNGRDQYEHVPMETKSCLICDSKFETNHPGSVYCSNHCRDVVEKELRANQRQKRRAIKKRAFVKRVIRLKIFERDEWICQICGDAVDQSIEYPDPFYPTIDHIVPLANGGTHEPGNVQLAHFICNSKKSNLISNVQV